MDSNPDKITKAYVPMDWDEYNRKRAIEDEKYRILQIEIAETQRSSKATLDGLQVTFANIDNTLKMAQQTQDNITNFQKSFDDVFQKLGERLTEAFQEKTFKALKPEDKTSKVISIKQAIPMLVNKKVLILSGAGLSVSSGIPTFRGEGGFWNHGGDKYKCQQVLTKEFLLSNPDKCWQWHREFQQILLNKKANIAHQSIAKYKAKYPNTVLVTQNIDNLQTMCLPQTFIKQGFHTQIFEIHGNIKYMRCIDNCSDKDGLAALFNMPDLSKVVMPTCPNCNAAARPHILFFDEPYTDLYSRAGSVWEQFEKCDVIIVVGTMLETGLSASIVRKAINQERTIIEVNTEPIVEIGRTFTLQGKSEDIMPQLLKLT